MVLKDKWKNNLGLKILAVLFAIFLWWMVVNIDDPIGTKKYTVDVTVTNPEVITNAGKSYQIIDDTKNISVTVKARRKVLDEIKKSNVVATADLREMQDTSVPIRVNVIGFEGEYEEVTANPRNIQVKVENTQKKTFPITTVAVGTPRDGYVVGSMTASPKTVDISGPESSIAKISKVVAKVDVSEMAADATAQVQLIYYDAADNLIDKTLLTSNCDKNGVSVSIDIWKTKELTLKFDTAGIEAATGYVFTDIEVEPQVVEVAGNPEILRGMTELVINKKALEKSEMTESEEVIVDIKEYLPEGVSLVDADAASVVVRIILEKAGTKTLRLPTGSIKVSNLSEDLQLAYDVLEVELTFSGSNENLEKLTSETIIAPIELSIDLKECTEEGIYTVPVKVTKLPSGCTYTEEVVVKIELTKKAE